jgi:hypothetical protein
VARHGQALKQVADLKKKFDAADARLRMAETSLGAEEELDLYMQHNRDNDDNPDELGYAGSAGGHGR